MTRLTLILFSTLTLALGFPSSSESPSKATQVDALFSQWDSTLSPGCVLGVMRDRRMIYQRGYGMANLDHGLAITPASVFRIGSTSKQFTAASVALLAHAGKLSLDDDIRKFLPEMPVYAAPITIRHLIHHTSGIRDYLTLMSLKGLSSDAANYSVQEVLDVITRQKDLNFLPGERELYSNSGYFLLAEIVQRASGQTLREYAEANIFEPLGMHHTHFHDDYTEVVPNRASGYAPNGEGFRVSMTTLNMVGDGGVFTTIGDLLRWDQNFYGNRLGGGAQLIAQLHTPGSLNSGESQNYAFGLGVDEYRGLKMVSHAGGFVGYRAELIRFPEQQFSVATLCNLSAINPSRLARQVADIYLADEFKTEPGAEAPSQTDPATAAELDPGALDRFTGMYYAAADRNLRKVILDSGRLYYWRGPESRNPLKPIGNNRFRMLEVPVAVTITFEGPEGTAPEAMILAVENSQPSRFKRVEPASYSDGELAEFTGRYYSEELDATYRIAVGDGKLQVTLPRSDAANLVAGFAYFFAVEEGGPNLEFWEEMGQPAGFYLSAGRVRGLRFVKTD